MRLFRQAIESINLTPIKMEIIIDLLKIYN